MQRYRVNIPLLLSLIVGVAVAGGAGYGVWKFQVNRNSGSVLKRAQAAREDGETREALKLYQQYLAIHPNEPEALIARAELWKSVAMSPDQRPEDSGIAYRVMEETVRALPKNDDLRRDLIGFLLKFRAYKDALEHARILQESNPGDKEAKVLYSRALDLANHRDAESYAYGLVGYDSASDSFDVEAAETPHEAKVYRNLAERIRKDDRETLADRIMDQLVEVNPDDYNSYLSRGHYYLAKNDMEMAEDDIRKAHELNPNDADVLVSLSAIEKDNENYEDSQALLEEGVSQFPEDARFYQLLAELAMREQNYELAQMEVDRGIEAVSNENSLILLAFKADLQIRAMDIEGVRKTIEMMEARRFRPEYVQWIEARILLVQSKWYEAAKALSDVRQRLTDFSDIRLQVEVQLGLCYEKLGKTDKALESYNSVLLSSPGNEPAAMGRQRLLARKGETPSDDVDGNWKQALQAELDKPEDEQNWPRITRMLDEQADKLGLSEAGQVLLKAEIFMLRKKYPESRKLLEQAFEMAPDELSVQRAAVRLLRQDPERGPINALKFLEGRVIPKFGDRHDLRVEKADLLIQINDSELDAQLEELTKGIEDWSDQDQISLWYSMGARYFSLGQIEKAKDCWREVTELSPNDLPTRVMLFTLAHDAGDDAGMIEAQKRILEVIDEEDATYQYTEARRLLSLVRRNQAAKESLEDVDDILRTALEQRPEWHDLHLVKAEIAMIRGNYDRALESYEMASQLGRPYPSAVVQHVRLLVAKGRFGQAKLIVDRLPEATRQRLLGQLYTEILFNNGLVDRSMDSAQKVIDADPLNAAKQLWYGRFLARTAMSDAATASQKKVAIEKAGVALQKAVEFGPGIPEAWITLLSFHVQTNNMDAAEETLREAQLAISSEKMPGVLAKCYEIMGRSFDAENLYRAAYEADPENPALARQLAVFYLSSSNKQSRQQKIAKATPLLNTILKAQAAGNIEATSPHVIWARRASAELLASSGDYQSLVNAERLLTSNMQGGVLPMQDKLQLAQILATRPEPNSRMKAIELLEEVRAASRLNLAADITLGQLYFMTGNWPKAEKQMLEVVARYPDEPAVRARFIQMLLRRDSASEARRHLQRLIKLAPRDLTTLELIARVSARTGNENAARSALRRILPSNLNEIKAEELPQLEKVADLLAEELNDTTGALKMYQFLASRNSSKVLKLASFMGRYIDPEKGFDLLSKVYKPEVAPAVLNSAIVILRARRDEVGDAFDQQVQGWLDSGLRENPDSVALIMQQAEFYDLQEKYDQAADTYRNLLATDSLKGSNRAVVLNNLSYLLALKGDASVAQEAVTLVDEAVQILGPTADILDTRAMVFIARGKYEDAIADLELSVTDNPTASKYFHKAMAHLLAGQNSNALEAWDKAQQLGLIREDLGNLERNRFDELQSEIEQLQTANRDTGGNYGRIAAGRKERELAATAN